MNKWPYVLGALIIIGFGYLGVTEMMAARMPYISRVSDVISSCGKPVQVIGTILHKGAHYSDSTNSLLFSLEDEKGETLIVSYKGIKPANFDSAPKAVVRGKYLNGILVADQLLLKCPSRYRGNEQ